MSVAFRKARWTFEPGASMSSAVSLRRPMRAGAWMAASLVAAACTINPPAGEPIGAGRSAIETALAACSTTPPPNAALDDAHRVAGQALASGEANRYAQTELARTRDALARADLAWADRHDDAETAHLAYLAAQNARLAMNLAAQRAADARIESAGAERERLRADI